MSRHSPHLLALFAVAANLILAPHGAVFAGDGYCPPVTDTTFGDFATRAWLRNAADQAGLSPGMVLCATTLPSLKITVGRDNSIQIPAGLIGHLQSEQELVGLLMTAHFLSDRQLIDQAKQNETGRAVADALTMTMATLADSDHEADFTPNSDRRYQAQTRNALQQAAIAHTLTALTKTYGTAKAFTDFLGSVCRNDLDRCLAEGPDMAPSAASSFARAVLSRERAVTPGLSLKDMQCLLANPEQSAHGTPTACSDIAPAYGEVYTALSDPDVCVASDLPAIYVKLAENPSIPPWLKQALSLRVFGCADAPARDRKFHDFLARHTEVLGADPVLWQAFATLSDRLGQTADVQVAMAYSYALKGDYARAAEALDLALRAPLAGQLGPHFILKTRQMLEGLG